MNPTLKFVTLKEDKRVFKDFRKLYKTAFPKEERVPLGPVKAKALTENSDIVCAYEKDEFIGILSLVYRHDVVYIFYFAVTDKKRGGGYGGAILQKLKDDLPHKKIGLNIEITDGESLNKAQRIRRKNFYLKNGFCECAFKMKERGVLYETLSFGGPFTREEFQDLMKNYFGQKIYEKYYEFPED